MSRLFTALAALFFIGFMSLEFAAVLAVRFSLSAFGETLLAGGIALFLIGLGVWRFMDKEEKRRNAIGSVPLSVGLVALGALLLLAAVVEHVLM